MTTISDTLASVNETTIGAITTAHERILASHRRAAALAAKGPSLPSWLARLARPLVTEDVLARTFDFNVDVIEANKRFALELAKVWTPAAATVD